jgi:hypothetical protein
LIDDTLDDAVGQPRQRHGQGFDSLALRTPFRRDGLGKRTRGHDNGAPRGRLDRLAVERDGKTAVGLANACARIKPLALDRARRPPRGLHRIDGGSVCSFVE